MNKIMEQYRFIELIVRRLYYSLDFVHKIMERKYKLISEKEKGVNNEVKVSWETIRKYIESLGIIEGDILIVHSSADGMKRVDVTPQEIINYLRNIVGETGTLVMAAYPNLEKRDNDGNVIYNPKRTAVTTGILPFLFCRMKGTIRSKCPLDTLAANGAEAEKMMKNNLSTDLAFGKGSAWEYCVKRHAKILFLGVPIYHSNTVTHVVEDMMEDRWPIDNWYEEQCYIIQDGQKKIRKSFRNRRQYWARYTTQHWNTSLYKKNILIKEKVIDGVSVGYNPDAYKLVEFLKNRAKNNKLPFVVPKRYWK